MRRTPAACLLVAALGCGEGPAEEPLGPCGAEACPAPQIATCFEGFEADGEGGCRPILPADPCPPGSLALPGDSACASLMDCGEGPWGNIPRDATTQHVDQSYAGSDSDGSEARPWTHINAAVTAAEPGAVIALAAGSYGENLDLQTKPLRILGRCPELVTIVGTASSPVAIIVGFAPTAGSELRGFSVTGPARGMVLSGTSDITLGELWLHDLGDVAIEISTMGEPVAVRVERILVEAASWVGVQTYGAALEMSDSVVRDTRELSDGIMGRGLDIEDSRDVAMRSSIDLQRSVVERNHETGIFIAASDGLIRQSVIRDSLPRASDQTLGRGLSIEDSRLSLERSNVTLTGNVIQRVFGVGLYVAGSDALVEDVVVEDVNAPPGTNRTGDGIAVERALDTSNLASAQLRRSLIRRVTRVGLLAYDTQVTADTIAVQAVAAQPLDGTFGDGVAVQTVEAPGVLDLLRSTVEGATRAGVVSFGGTLTVADSQLECNSIQLTLGVQGGELLDGGGNQCGCGAEAEPCQILSSMLTAPTPIGAN